MNSKEAAELLNGLVDQTRIVDERALFASSDKNRFIDILRALKSKGVTHISAITGLDNGTSIEVIYHFNCNPAELSLKIFLPRDDPHIPTITEMFPGAILYERDLMEMLGVKVDGHPDPRRLFLPDDWPEGDYPLRKKPEEKSA